MSTTWKDKAYQGASIDDADKKEWDDQEKSVDELKSGACTSSLVQKPEFKIEDDVTSLFWYVVSTAHQWVLRKNVLVSHSKQRVP